MARCKKISMETLHKWIDDRIREENNQLSKARRHQKKIPISDVEADIECAHFCDQKEAVVEVLTDLKFFLNK